MATQRIIDFLATRRPAGPCLVVDLDVVETNFGAFRKALPNSAIYYAVKANPAPEILRLLADLGSSFDCASVAEIEMAMDAGATADRISFGNTIKKERDIARAFDLGVDLYAVDCVEEVEKVARAAPGAKVFCRILTNGEGAEWPLSRKFGCVPAMADRRAGATPQSLGLDRHGVSFHVGSQQTDPMAWDVAIADASRGLPDTRRQRHRPDDGQPRRRVPDPLPQGRADGGEPTATRSSPRSAAFRQPPARHDHRAGPRHGRRRRRDQDRSRAGLAQVRRPTRTAGSISTSASSAASPRRWTRPSATRSHPARRRPRRSPASSPARPAIRPTCSTRRTPTRCRSALDDRRRGADRGERVPIRRPTRPSPSTASNRCDPT